MLFNGFGAWVACDLVELLLDPAGRTIPIGTTRERHLQRQSLP